MGMSLAVQVFDNKTPKKDRMYKNLLIIVKELFLYSASVFISCNSIVYLWVFTIVWTITLLIIHHTFT